MDGRLARKIVPIDELARTLERERAAGRTVVHCHGCFDIVHPGHLRYLQFARQLGDVLVVSLTGDEQIDKGPDRPYIPQELRAENLAALEFVDWVVIDPHPTACELLGRLRPDVYVKGGEYAGSTDPRFVRERRAVEAYGGRVVFYSGDVVFSSSRLIEQLAPSDELDVQRLRALCRRRGITRAALRALLESFCGRTVLVIGDVVRERYVLCDVLDAADDLPMPLLRQVAMRSYWAGAAAVALALRALGARPVLVSRPADAAGSRAACQALADCGLTVHWLPPRPGGIERTVLVAGDDRLLRVDEGACAPLDSHGEALAIAAAQDALHAARLVVWWDGGYGMVTPGLVRRVGEHVAASRCRAAAGGCGPGARPDRIPRLDLLLTSERQLRRQQQDMTSSVPALVHELLTRSRSRAALVSLGRRGMLAFQARDPAAPDDAPAGRLHGEFVPSRVAAAVDWLGVPESVLAVAGLALACDAPLALAAYLAAAVEALVVAQPGFAAVGLSQLAAWLDGRPELDAPDALAPDGLRISDLALLAPPIALQDVRP